MADPGSVNNSGTFLRPDINGSQESLTSSLDETRNSRHVHFAEFSTGRGRSVTVVAPERDQRHLADTLRERTSSIDSGGATPRPQRRRIVTVPHSHPSRTPRHVPPPPAQTPLNYVASERVREVPIKITVASLRESFGGLIERTAGGAQKVSSGYDATIRSHFDNIRASIKDDNVTGDKAAITAYLDYLEGLLPPRPSNEEVASDETLPNGDTVSAENKQLWLDNYAKPITRLKTDWAIVAGQIGSLQNASNRDQAIAQIRGQLAYLESSRLELLNRNPGIDKPELRQAINDLETYQQYLYTRLEKKIEAIRTWELEAGAEAVHAFKVANLAINELPGKPETRRLALENIKEALNAVPEAPQNTKSQSFLKAQQRFFEREAKIIDIWKAAGSRTDRTRTKAEFLQVRQHIHQNTFAYLDRIEARNNYATQLLDKYPTLDQTARAEVTRQIRGVLILNKRDYDAALKNLPSESKIKASQIKTIFPNFNHDQSQLERALKQAESAPQAPPKTDPTPPSEE